MVQHIIRQETEDWIARHFPGIFNKLHFGNHYSGASIRPY